MRDLLQIGAALNKQEDRALKPLYVKVHLWGERVRAYCDKQGDVWVYDSVAGHKTLCHSLTKNQIRFVKGRVRWED